MRIYSMTATFGKLEHETLTLQPGFNLIQAPNEWGKSTWCAFLTAMLYGLETRSKTTKNALADKEHYAPWSGSPMSGRVNLNWNGRDITIERNTRGRIPLGEFRAYETESGLPVGELNAANCGQVLLGVERSVFFRSAFIRLSDLPVTQDEALRRRLNALVSTGDESSAGDRLAKGLKDLKNKCRYHKTGLIPQTEAQRDALEEKLREMERLTLHSEKLKARLAERNNWIAQLENHKEALAFAAAETDAQHVALARQRRDEADRRVSELDGICAGLPDREQVQWALTEIGRLEQAVQALDMEEKLADGNIPQPMPPAFLGDRTPEEALEKVLADGEQYQKLTAKRRSWPVFGILLAIAGAVGADFYPVPGWICAGLGLVFLLVTTIASIVRKRSVGKLIALYQGEDPDAWVAEAEAYCRGVRNAQAAEEQQKAHREELEARRTELDQKINRMTQGRGLQHCRQQWETGLADWDAFSDALRELHRAEHQLRTLRAMARTAQPPQFPDRMTCTEAETNRLLSDSYEERRQMETRLSQYAGQLTSLGDKVQLKQQLDACNRQLRKLEDTYAALSIAQETLAEATAELQRRFAPRISQRARELMHRMTAGRYDRLQLEEDFSLAAGAELEDTLQNTLWRSDGTVDQLYLALRLAVAEELMPNGPLILDDALVRFDDERLKAALDILQEEAARKQVILFSCQSREQKLL